MSEFFPLESAEVAAKIAALVKEKGWNQEDFARMTQLNRQTVRQILHPSSEHRLRNATVSACARALGLSVHDLLTQPLEKLLQRLQGKAALNGDDRLRQLVDLVTQPELRSWLERNPERARQFTEQEIQELLALQGHGGPLTAFGVESFASLLERRRNLITKVQAIANTEYLELLEQLVELIHDRIHQR